MKKCKICNLKGYLGFNLNTGIHKKKLLQREIDLDKTNT